MRGMVKRLKTELKQQKKLKKSTTNVFSVIFVHLFDIQLRIDNKY